MDITVEEVEQFNDDVAFVVARLEEYLGDYFSPVQRRHAPLDQDLKIVAASIVGGLRSRNA